MKKRYKFSLSLAVSVLLVNTAQAAPDCRGDHRAGEWLRPASALAITPDITPDSPQQKSNARATPGPATKQVEVERLIQSGIDSYRRADYLVAQDIFERSLALTREMGDRPLEGLVLNYLGLISESLGQYDQALAYHNENLALTRAMGDRAAESTTLNNIGAVYDRLGQYRLALDHYEQVLTIVRELAAIEGPSASLGYAESGTLNNIGAIYRNLGQYVRALDYYEQALTLIRDVGDRTGEGVILNNLGLVYDALGQYDRALNYYEQSLAIRREVGDRAGEGTTLNNIGLTLDNLGQYEQSLDYYEQALTIQRSIGARAGEGVALAGLGLVYHKLGQYAQALNYHEQSLAIRREIRNLVGEGRSLNNIGGVYESMGQYAQALTQYQQALTIMRDVGARGSEGVTLNNIGGIYHKLGQYQQALTYYEQALVLRQELGDRPGEGISLNNIGSIYSDLGEYTQALDYYAQSLAVTRDIGDRVGEGVVLNNIGGVYSDLGEHGQALDHYQQALIIVQALGDRAKEGIALNNIGLAYQRLNDPLQALDYYQQSLAVKREIGDPAGEGVTLNNIGWLLDISGEPELAIVFLKQAVDAFEIIRQGNLALSQTQQASYTDTIAGTYRKLADLLLQENRLLEAQAVLDLLRTQELEDYFQDVRSSATAEAELEYWRPEERILSLYADVLLAKDELALLRAQNPDSLTPEQATRKRALEAREGELIDSFFDFVDTPAVAAAIDELRTETDGQNIELDSLIALQNNIANLPNAVLIYPMIFEDRLELILVSPDAPPIRRPVEVSAATLNEAILAYRNALRYPGSTGQAQALANRLYTWLMAPLEADLARLNPQQETQTIVYSPDGALRYIPLAALHDGEQWLAERFAITHITVESISDFDTPPQPSPSILAAACAECSFSPTVADASYRFDDLPFTRIEVDTLAEQIPTADVLLNQAFSKAETVSRLSSYNIIHLATHGAFVSDSPDNSFLLFGDGEVATLRDIRRWNLQAADLVVLSACETGLGGPNLGGQTLGNGIEVLGLGYQIQRAGAKAALASLWRVNDGGTQALMNAFYLALSEGHSKAEALRLAQLALIKNDLSVIDQGASRSATLTILDDDTGEPLTLDGTSDHPFYWAPFILIGNGL